MLDGVSTVSVPRYRDKAGNPACSVTTQESCPFFVLNDDGDMFWCQHDDVGEILPDKDDLPSTSTFHVPLPKSATRTCPVWRDHL